MRSCQQRSTGRDIQQFCDIRMEHVWVSRNELTHPFSPAPLRCGLSEEINESHDGALIVPWGRLHPQPRKDIVKSLQVREGEAHSRAAVFWDWLVATLDKRTFGVQSFPGQRIAHSRTWSFTSIDVLGLRRNVVSVVHFNSLILKNYRKVQPFQKCHA